MRGDVATTGVPSGKRLLWSCESGSSGGLSTVDRDGNDELLLPRCVAGGNMVAAAGGGAFMPLVMIVTGFGGTWVPLGATFQRVPGLVGVGTASLCNGALAGASIVGVSIFGGTRRWVARLSCWRTSSVIVGN